MNSARATIGGPICESRTACNTALFHLMTTFCDCAIVHVRGVLRMANAIATAFRGKSRRVLWRVISLLVELGHWPSRCTRTQAHRTLTRGRVGRCRPWGESLCVQAEHRSRVQSVLSRL